jgi:hypothetical protein
MASIPVGTCFAIYLANPLKITSDNGVQFDFTQGTVTDGTTTYSSIEDYVLSVGSDAAATEIKSAAETLQGNPTSLSAIFTVGELLTGTLVINPEEYECNYSIEGNTESTFNLTIRWGTLANGQVIHLTNCSIQDKKVNGTVSTWSYVLDDGITVSGNGGTINPISTI